MACQVLRSVLQLFDTDTGSLHLSASLSHRQSFNNTDKQQIPKMLLTSAEMMDRFKKIVITCVDFVLFSGQ